MTKRQQFWIGLAGFIFMYFGLFLALEEKAFNQILSMFGAFYVGQLAHSGWHMLTDKYVKKS